MKNTQTPTEPATLLTGRGGKRAEATGRGARAHRGRGRTRPQRIQTRANRPIAPFHGHDGQAVTTGGYMYTTQQRQQQNSTLQQRRNIERKQTAENTETNLPLAPKITYLQTAHHNGRSQGRKSPITSHARTEKRKQLKLNICALSLGVTGYNNN